MKLCNDVITVFNARADPETGGNVWTPTVIANASWYMTDASTVDASKGGLVAANKIVVRIPAEAAPEGFGLKAGDIIVKGAVPLTETVTVNGVSSTVAIDWTPAKLKKAYAEDCATVLGVTDNRRAPNAPHFRVVGS
jgi:hypothetical protein